MVVAHAAKGLDQQEKILINDGLFPLLKTGLKLTMIFSSRHLRTM